ncbi:MAG: hypothetical protein SF052_08735 [Bacteroidia bacterium]|nr:hypothetical protein [Bacteroidia bacterium]
MRLYLRPYQLFLIFAALVAMVFLLKINKRSFYFHYFRVIEEVELRNSQEMGVYTQLAQLHNLTPALPAISYGFFSLLFTAGIFVLFLLKTVRISFFANEAVPASQFLLSLPPVRAP